MKILSFSYCFPNSASPTWGLFVYQRLKALARMEQLQTCSPQPWFPLLKGQAGRDSEDLFADMKVHRPRFFYFPGVLKDSDAWFYCRGLRRWLQSFANGWPPDILDAHFVWPDGVAVAGLAHRFDIPYVITLRGKIYECLKSASQTRQVTRALQGAAAVISVSSRMAEEALRLGVDKDRLHVIPNGVNRQQFLPRDKLECRRRLSLPEQGRLLVTVAHLGHRKGHHEVIQALADLPDDVRLIIVGGAAQGGTVEELQTLARSFGAGSRVILPGAQPYDRVPHYFSAADASVLASYREGCPNAVLESLACGTPVVATDVGAVPDILPTPAAGRIVPVQQIEPLREAITSVIETKWIAEDVVKMSGVRSWDEVAGDVQKVMKGVLSTKS